MKKQQTRAVLPSELSTPEDDLVLQGREEAQESGDYCEWCDSALQDPCTEEQSKTCPNRLADEEEERQRGAG